MRTSIDERVLHFMMLANTNMAPYQLNVKPIRHPLAIREFFEFYDPGDPYHNAALTWLQTAIEKADPMILDSRADWFAVWSQGGKR